MQELDDVILDLERRFWTGDEGFYLENVDATCLIAFVGMQAAFSRNALAATVRGSRRWRDVEIVLKGQSSPVDGVAMLTYEATASRDDGKNYKAMVSSVYVRRESGWKLTLHQHTPI